MIRIVGEQPLILHPSHYSTMIDTKWSPLFHSDIRSTEVLFTQAKYSGYSGVVCTNPLTDNVSNGMHLSDYDLGFGTHNYGCSVDFKLDTSSDLY